MSKVQVVSYEGEALLALKDDIANSLYGMTKAEAHAKGICIQCQEPAIPKCYSDAGREEYKISGLCEECFDQIMGGGDNE